jgi:hypothetical protein
LMRLAIAAALVISHPMPSPIMMMVLLGKLDVLFTQANGWLQPVTISSDTQNIMVKR